MPVIVDEVVISVEVGGEGATTGGGNSGSAGDFDRHALVQECVERVLDILRQKGER